MSQAKSKVAFEMRKREVELARLLPTKLVKDAQNLRRYRAIVASLPEIGLIEPLMVYPQGAGSENWLVLDGHLRLLAMKQLGKTTVEVIVASEDERFTYNARVNRLPPIQAHKMIVKAVRNGVKPERLSAALFMPMHTVSALINLLDGINPEAAELLKDKQMTADAIRLLRKVTGLRQIEIAEVLVSANNFTKSYAEALVLATPRDQMVSPEEDNGRTGADGARDGSAGARFQKHRSELHGEHDEPDAGARLHQATAPAQVLSNVTTGQPPSVVTIAFVQVEMRDGLITKKFANLLKTKLLVSHGALGLGP